MDPIVRSEYDKKPEHISSGFFAKTLNNAFPQLYKIFILYN